MLNCQQTRYHLNLTDYVETGSLPPGDLERHLSACEACQQYQREMQALKTLLRDQQRVTAPEDFDLQLRARMRSTTRRERPVWFAWLPTPALATMAAIVVAAVVYSLLPLRQGTVSAPPVNLGRSSGPITSSEKPNTVTAEVLPPVAIATDSSAESVPVRHTTRISRNDGISTNGKMLLLVRDQNNREHMVTVPNVIYGAQPVINTNSPKVENDNENQHIF